MKRDHWLRKTAARGLRRGYPIHAYVGPNGSGKSLAAVWDTMPTLAAGRPVLSTVRLLDWQNPRPCDDPACDSPDHARHAAAHPLWVPLTEWHQLLDAEHCDVLMDEVTGVASSRESAGMPAAVANLLVQLRRRDVVLRWTAPSWARADKIIRETSQAVTSCLGYMPVDDGEGDRQWRSRRLFRWRTFDASEFEEFTVGKRDQMRPWAKEWWWGPGSAAFDAYDTLDSVMTIGHVLDTGRCARCGGRRSVPRCTCEPGAHLADSDALSLVAS
ncbi:zonular occludens toxin domain-containing protein [Cellulomonas hominis]